MIQEVVQIGPMWWFVESVGAQGERYLSPGFKTFEDAKRCAKYAEMISEPERIEAIDVGRALAAEANDTLEQATAKRDALRADLSEGIAVG